MPGLGDRYKAYRLVNKHYSHGVGKFCWVEPKEQDHLSQILEVLAAGGPAEQPEELERLIPH